jgi:hypothetical protein
MVRKRFIIIVSLLALVLTGGIQHQAGASLNLDCRFDLLKDRFDAVDGLISASHNFTRDVTGFIDVGASSTSEINSNYRQALRDLAQDLRAGTQDIAAARSEAVQDIAAQCNFSRTRAARALVFYSRMQHRLNVTYRKAKHALHVAYVAALDACCID